jgi:polysaccharide pyruvyl transferase WcaK-like protein
MLDSNSSKSRGLVFGFYHKRNAGDDRLAYCLERLLSDCELTFLPHTYRPPVDLLLDADFAIIGGGSVANAYHGVFQKLSGWAEVAKIPVFLLGIGVSDNKKLINEIQKISLQKNRVWVRDAYSLKLLGDSKKIRIAPDLTWLYPVKNDENTISKGVCINLCPPLKQQYSLSSWANEIRNLENDYSIFPWPLHYGNGQDKDYMDRLDLKQVIPEEFTLRSAEMSEIIVSMRYHAILFALQMGKPFVPIYNSKKVSFFVETTPWAKNISYLEDEKLLKQSIQINKDLIDRSEIVEYSREMTEAAWEAASVFCAEIRDAVSRSQKIRRNHFFRIRSKLRNLIHFY